MMTRIFAQPVSQLTDMDRLFDSLFDQTIRQPFVQGAARRGTPVLPPINIWEDEHNVLVEAEVPGMTMENLELLVQDDQLTLRGQRQPQSQPTQEQPQAQRAFIRRERWFGQFERTISLPAPVEGEQAQATLHQGVLTVTLPKAASARPRRIEIRPGVQQGQ